MSNQTASAVGAIANAVNWERKGLDLQKVIDAANQGKLGQPLTDWLASQAWNSVPVETGQIKPSRASLSEPKVEPQAVERILRKISGDSVLSLDATDGTETIANAGAVFTGYLDRDYENYLTNVPSGPSAAVNVEVHEIISDGNFEKIFGSFESELDNLCLSQGQIIQFPQKHSKWLHPKGYATLILFKSHGEFFVASVYRYPRSGVLEANVYRFSNDYVGYADYRNRVVVPQLKLGS